MWAGLNKSKTELQTTWDFGAIETFVAPWRSMGTLFCGLGINEAKMILDLQSITLGGVIPNLADKSQ